MFFHPIQRQTGAFFNGCPDRVVLTTAEQARVQKLTGKKQPGKSFGCLFDA